MTIDTLERVVRSAGGQIRSVLAARFRDLDLAEDAFADACLKAAQGWDGGPVPDDPAALLYRMAERAALDRLRKEKRRRALAPVPDAAAQPRDSESIPDERLRLIFVCCHPAIAANARAALTLRLVCGLETEEIARAFLVPESTLAQRLVRAKRKIAEAGIGFEIPGPEQWPERLEAVLSTLEVAYGEAYGDAAGAGPHAGYARGVLELAALLAELVPGTADTHALAALVHYAEARRPARVDGLGVMVPLSEQDPALWDRDLIARGEHYLGRALALSRARPRCLQAALHAAWCDRRAVGEPPPWRHLLVLYNRLLLLRDDALVRLNRIVPLLEVEGVEAARSAYSELPADLFDRHLPYYALGAELARRAGDEAAALAAYDRCLALGPGPAETAWLRRRRTEIFSSTGRR